MEFRMLEYFVEVARSKNISRASKILHVSQPAISKNLQLLENELGKKLFQRINYGIELTKEGILFYRRAEDILEMVHKTKTEFEKMSEIAGDIYIGCAESNSIKYFVRVLKSVQENYPKICCHIYSGNYEDVYYRLDNGLLDFCITFQNFDVTKYDFLNLPEPDEWGIILRKDDPLAEKKFFTLEDLKNLPLIISREGVREEYPKWFGKNFDRLKIVATYNLIFNAGIMVQEGVGYLLSLDKILQNDKICFRPLYPQLKSELRFIWKKNQLFTPAAQILLDEIKNCLNY